MFLILKMARVTCAFYLAGSILLEALLLGVVHWKGGIFYWFNFKSWGAYFRDDLAGFVCFDLACRHGPTLG